MTNLFGAPISQTHDIVKLGTAIPVTRVSNVMERLYLINKLAKFQDAIAIVVSGVLRTGRCWKFIQSVWMSQI